MALRTIINHSLQKLKPYKNIQYYSSSTIISKNLYKPSLPILSTPWLMLPPDVRDGPNGPTDNFLNIIDKSIIKIDRSTAHEPVPQNTMCVGSAKGWIAFDCDTDNTSFYLVNPYNTTKSSCCKVPRLYNFAIFRKGLHFTLDDDDLIGLIDDERDRDYQYDSRDGHMVAYSRKTKMKYKLKLKEGKYNREVENHGKIQVTWSCRSSKTMGEFYSFIDPKFIKDDKFSWDRSVEKFVVVADDDDDDEPRLFLVVRRLVKEEQVRCKTTDIELFEIIKDREVVERVESIGDKALFIGRNSEPFFVSTRDGDGRGLRSNCVYVAEELGYYDLETKCVTPVVSLGDLVDIRPQVYWIAPPASSL